MPFVWRSANKRIACTRIQLTTSEIFLNGPRAVETGVKAEGGEKVLDLKLLQPHRQLSNTLAGGVEDRVADGRVGSDIAQFADSLDAGRIDVVVLFGCAGAP
jgi:hypothetical protein